MSLHDALLEGIAAFEVFRQLGYGPDDIYFVPRTDDVPPAVSLAVKKGDKMFILPLGPYPEGETEEAVNEQWVKLAEQYNAGKIEGFEEIFYSSRPRTCAAVIVAGLVAKGLYPHRQSLTEE